MTTSTAEPATVAAMSVRFEGERLFVDLSDGRGVSLDLRSTPWLAWLFRATPRPRAGWSVEPGGFAVYWDELDDGIEVAQVLSEDSNA